MNFKGSTNRRGRHRFPIREDVRYRTLHAGGEPADGVGETLDIGSGGILFTTEEKLPMGRPVEVAVNWPVRLDGACPLQLVAVGKVVRSEASQAAVQISRYEFKTRGTSGVAASAAD